MGFIDIINNDLKEAMKAKNETGLRGIRAIKAAILLANTDGSGLDLTEERGIQIVQKLVKQRRESLEIYEKQGRQDLAQIERDEIDVISKYLPAQLSEAELRTVITEIINQLGAKSPSDMGKVMGAATQKLEVGLPIPVVITVYNDKSFTFIMKTPPASILLKKAAGIQKGSAVPNKTKVGKLTRAQLEEIATTKEPDLTGADLDARVRTIAGSARSMGLEVEL